eukprot:3760452-Alexandrium_andersonii.AAC.1
MSASLVGSEMCIRDRSCASSSGRTRPPSVTASVARPTGVASSTPWSSFMIAPRATPQAVH